jgi:H+-translocating NAD(P) transhydrogenase subunit beta
MQSMISHFPFSATDLMAAALGMSGLALLITLLAASLFVASMNAAGASLMLSAVHATIGFLLRKLWLVSLLPMLALYNGIGGGAAVAVATAGMFDSKIGGASQVAATLTVALLGAVSLSGSLIAWARINGLVTEPPSERSRKAFSSVVIAIIVVTGGYIAFTANGGANLPAATPVLIFWLLGSALVFGALITFAFSRAQMPVIISLYNACTGLAIGLEGVIIQNRPLLIVGIVVGSARLLVTLLMAEPSHENWRFAAHTGAARISRRHVHRFSGMRGRHKPM